MTVFFFLIALAAFFFTLGVWCVQNKTALRVLLTANIAAAAAGGVLLAASVILSESAGRGEEVSPALLSWAADAFSLWLRSAGILSAAAGGTLLLASLTDHRMRRVRAIAGCALVWLLLLLGGAYASTCTGAALDPAPWIRLCTAGLSLLVTVWSIPDLIRRRRENAKKSAKKRNIRA